MVVPEVRRPQAGGVVEVASRDGSQVAQVAALPWVPERALFGAEEMMGLEEEPNKAYAEELPRLLGALCSAFRPGKIHLLAAHVFVGGARVGGGERELTVGDLFAIAPQGLPATPQHIRLRPVPRPAGRPAVHRARPRPPPAGGAGGGGPGALRGVAAAARLRRARAGQERRH